MALLDLQAMESPARYGGGGGGGDDCDVSTLSIALCDGDSCLSTLLCC